MKTISVPEYMAKFHCIGPECEANCCDNDWIIVIDKKTYQKYMELGDSVCQLQIQTCFHLNTENQSDNYYAELVKNLAANALFKPKTVFVRFTKHMARNIYPGLVTPIPGFSIYLIMFWKCREWYLARRLPAGCSSIPGPSVSLKPNTQAMPNLSIQYSISIH